MLRTFRQKILCNPSYNTLNQYHAHERRLPNPYVIRYCTIVILVRDDRGFVSVHSLNQIRVDGSNDNTRAVTNQIHSNADAYECNHTYCIFLHPIPYPVDHVHYVGMRSGTNKSVSKSLVNSMVSFGTHHTTMNTYHCSQAT